LKKNSASELNWGDISKKEQLNPSFLISLLGYSLLKISREILSAKNSLRIKKAALQAAFFYNGKILVRTIFLLDLKLAPTQRVVSAVIHYVGW